MGTGMLIGTICPGSAELRYSEFKSKQKAAEQAHCCWALFC